MAKDPIFPLYYNDIDRSTKTWTDEEFGAYMRLLMHQWDQGHLPKDYQKLARIATSLETTWPLLKSKFEEVDGTLQNMNLEVIRAKRLKHKQKQKENADMRYQKPAKVSAKRPAKPLPLETENENENEYSLLKEYDSWTSKILDKEDPLFQVMFMNERIPASENIPELIVDHRDLLNRYPNMRPPDQQAFRRSCLKHIKENLNKVKNVTGASKKKTVSFDQVK